MRERVGVTGANTREYRKPDTESAQGSFTAFSMS